jgi:hypothetical protein
VQQLAAVHLVWLKYGIRELAHGRYFHSMVDVVALQRSGPKVAQQTIPKNIAS